MASLLQLWHAVLGLLARDTAEQLARVWRGFHALLLWPPRCSTQLHILPAWDERTHVRAGGGRAQCRQRCYTLAWRNCTQLLVPLQ